MLYVIWASSCYCVYVLLHSISNRRTQAHAHAHACACVCTCVGKGDSIHHHLLEAVSETANVLELRQKLLYTTPSGWWWCIKSVFRYFIVRTLQIKIPESASSCKVCSLLTAYISVRTLDPNIKHRDSQTTMSCEKM